MITGRTRSLVVLGSLSDPVYEGLDENLVERFPSQGHPCPGCLIAFDLDDHVAVCGISGKGAHPVRFLGGRDIDKVDVGRSLEEHQSSPGSTVMTAIAHTVLRKNRLNVEIERRIIKDPLWHFEAAAAGREAICSCGNDDEPDDLLLRH